MNMQSTNPSKVQEISDLLYELKAQMEARDEKETAKCEEKDRSCTVQIADLK